MIDESPSEIAAAICLAVSVFAASLVPWLLLVNAECLVPAWLRATPAAAREAYARAALSAAALLLILTAPKGAVR
ncbi:hypothetical protein [Streptomyces alboflavus]|uniref:hypothetical protein n=1 Tax=Streptomyces alboflavus TaxID=67267 RepID=UPI0004BEBAB6|nr:hypothetical protein [Streptomyces alboflavus]